MSAVAPEAEPQLRDIPGPSALGGGRRRALELLWIIALTDFKRSYFGTALGYLWSVCRPLMLFGVLLVVFTHVFRLGHTVAHYPVFLLLGIVLFTFFQEATGLAVSSIVGHEAVIRKTQFPRIVIPLAVVGTCALNLVPNLLVAFVFILADGVAPAWTWLLLAPLLLVLGAITAAVSMLVAALYPRFRDLGIIWSVFSTALFYATPVLYPITAVHRGLRDVIALNPLSPLFDLVHRWVIDPRAPLPGSAATGGPLRLVVAVVLFAGVCAVSAWVFAREAPRVAEEV